MQLASSPVIAYIAGMITRYANPTAFAALLVRIQPYLLLLTVGTGALGLYQGLITSPPDYQQGETVRIMYIHVPAAWAALGIYSIMTASSFVFLVWRHAAADLTARYSALIALVMACMTLITGAIWGRPTWGAYWVWDARLTSMLILAIMLLGYHMLAMQADHTENKQKICAIYCLFGAINLPIIKFSVEWWNTLHQPASVLRLDGPTIDPAMLTPLLLMAVAFFALYFYILSLRIRTALLKAKTIRLRARLIQRQQRATS